MGRPLGSKNKKPTKASVKNMKVLRDSAYRDEDPFAELTDGQVLHLMHGRFDVMNRMVSGCLDGSVRGLIISGAPGIGKTFNVEEAVKRAKHNDPGFKSKIIKGAITPVNLFKVLQDHRHKGNVVILDDADSIFYDDVGIALLKAALDSGTERWISWLSEGHALKEGDHEYDKEFEFNGTMIFITNTDFQHFVDNGKSKLVPHFAALLSRSIYMDLKVHTIRAITIWIQYLVTKADILVERFGVTPTQQKEALAYILEHNELMRCLSLREAMKIGQMMKADYEGWQEIADVTLLKEVVYRG